MLRATCGILVRFRLLYFHRFYVLLRSDELLLHPDAVVLCHDADQRQSTAVQQCFLCILPKDADVPAKQ